MMLETPVDTSDSNQNGQVIVYKATEQKRYDFEAKGVEEAAEIVDEIKRGVSRYQNV